MKEILIFETSILGVTLVFAYLAWRNYGNEAVEKFGPDLKDPSLDNHALFKKKKRLGMISEMLRAAEVAFISTITYAACVQATEAPLRISELFHATWFRVALIVASSLSILWCTFLGPWMLKNEKAKDKRFWSKYVWKNIRLPYMMWIPYLIGVFYLMGGLLVVVLVTCAKQEIEALRQVAGSFQSLQGADVDALQLAALEVNRFGRMISLYSQKYIMVSILAVVFVAVEQHSYMLNTQWLGNLDIMKLGVVLLFASTLIVSLGYLPMIYRDVHRDIQDALDDKLIGLRAAEELTIDVGVMKDTQEHLEDHDLRWLFLKTVSGYGNLLSLTIIGGSLLLQRIFFKEIPARKFAILMLPNFMIHAIDQLTSTLGFQRTTGVLANPKTNTK